MISIAQAHPVALPFSTPDITFAFDNAFSHRGTLLTGGEGEDTIRYSPTDSMSVSLSQCSIQVSLCYVLRPDSLAVTLDSPLS